MVGTKLPWARLWCQVPCLLAGGQLERPESHYPWWHPTRRSSRLEVQLQGASLGFWRVFDLRVLPGDRRWEIWQEPLGQNLLQTINHTVRPMTASVDSIGLEVPCVQMLRAADRFSCQYIRLSLDLSCRFLRPSIWSFGDSCRELVLHMVPYGNTEGCRHCRWSASRTCHHHLRCQHRCHFLILQSAHVAF